MKRKFYTIIVTEDDDGNEKMKRICRGFTALELLGLLEYTSRDIIDQMEGRISPKIKKIERIFEEENKDG